MTSVCESRAGRRLALITGASAGIGEAFSSLLAARGYDLVLTARRTERLERLGRHLSLKFAVDAVTITADLADPETPLRIFEHLTQKGRGPDVLINSAGYAWPEYDADTGRSLNRAFIQVMFTAPYELAHLALAGMTPRRFGRIVNVASLAGVIPTMGGQALYGAIKAGMVKFSQGLHQEAARSGVHVTALCPGLTRSEFHGLDVEDRLRSHIPSWLWQTAEQVAAAGYAAVEANHPLCIPGASNKALAAAAKLLPERWVQAALDRQVRRLPSRVV